ncbi:MAG: trypsin-like peptidase domain-containing protein [Patescibacteria group bacterium]|nr:trypsin-like peptidase domain-containing protein [Patescibacteria group bacterium]
MKKTFKFIGIGLLIFIIGGLGGVFLNYMLISRVVADPDLSQNPIIKALDQRVQIIKSTEKIIVAETESIADIASRASTTVVYIESVDAQNIVTSGNGIVISSDGVIATTTSVVPKNNIVQYVKLSDGTVYDVAETNVDEYTGIVFLRIDASDLATIAFANSDDARSGKRLIAISRTREDNDAQFALGGFLGRERVFNIALPMSDFLQGVLVMDLSQTALRHSVGAPAVDFQGNMVGLISYKIEDSGGEKQKNYYAIAANDVYRAFEDLLQSKETDVMTQNVLGVNYQMINPLNVHINDMNITDGAIIDTPKTYTQQKIFANSQAARSGLGGGDVVVMVNNETVDMKNNLSRLMHKYRNSKEKIVLKVLRGDELLTIDVITR